MSEHLDMSCFRLYSYPYMSYDARHVVLRPNPETVGLKHDISIRNMRVIAQCLRICAAIPFLEHLQSCEVFHTSNPKSFRRDPTLIRLASMAETANKVPLSGSPSITMPLWALVPGPPDSRVGFRLAWKLGRWSSVLGNNCSISITPVLLLHLRLSIK